MTWTLFVCDGVSQYQVECDSYPDLGAKDIMARMSDGTDCLVNPRFVVVASRNGEKKTVQQTLEVGDGKRKDRPMLVREILRDRGWRSTGQIMGDLRITDIEERQSILRVLDRMVLAGKVERYPPTVEGRRMARDSIDWRLKEESE